MPVSTDPSMNASASGPRLALVVDDDGDMVLMLSEFVRACGYEAVGVQSFADFVTEMERVPSVLLLDLIMPEATSERIVEWLAFHDSRIPIVLVSSLSLDSIERRQAQAVALGLHSPAILRKPFWLADVAAVLTTAAATSTSRA